MDNLTAKNVPSGGPRGLCENRTGLIAVYRELWAIYCSRVAGPWAEGVCVAFIDIFIFLGRLSDD